MHHGDFAMFKDELEDTSWSFCASFVYVDKLEMPIQSSHSDREDEAVEPFMYCSPRYFALSRGTYDLMVKDLFRQVKVTLEALRDVSSGAPLSLHALGT